MIVSKRFMDWAIGLTRIAKTRTMMHPASAQSHQINWMSSSQFRALRWRLLRSYLSAMIAVIGLSTMVVYHAFTHDLYEQLDAQLTTIADAARHNFTAIQANPTAVNLKLPQTTDNDGDLDLPWQDLRSSHQSVEWFDAQQHRLSSTGAPFPETPLVLNFHPQQHQRTRILTLPVYLSEATEQSQSPQGYVRVSAPISEIEEEQKRLLAGFYTGGAISILLIGGTGFWLTGRALKPIEQNMQKLQQFTGDASHELRNPLTAIKTAVEVIQSHPERIHPVDVNKINTITSATQQMARLVEDLLMLARAETSLMSSAHIPIPLHEILEDLVEEFQAQADAKNLSLRIDELNEAFVQGDANPLRRLFMNMIDNAIKYTPAGGTVSVALSRTDTVVIVQIRDTGIGIAPEHIPHVFDRLWRADQVRAHQDGAGLGLAIAQAIAQAYKGEITVKSQLGMGSCFQVRLSEITD